MTSVDVEAARWAYDSAVTGKKEPRSCYHSRMAAKECPMCGEFMRLVTREASEHVPGLFKPITHVIREWICPECDYFEDVED